MLARAIELKAKGMPERANMLLREAVTRVDTPAPITKKCWALLLEYRQRERGSDALRELGKYSGGSLPARITDNEKQRILALKARGYNSNVIALHMGRSQETIKRIFKSEQEEAA